MNTTVFFIISGIAMLVALVLVFVNRRIPKYKIHPVKGEDGKEVYFPMIRKGWNSYLYLELILDAPGYVDDKFDTSELPIGEQETEYLAEQVISNHMMTTVSGIE